MNSTNRLSKVPDPHVILTRARACMTDASNFRPENRLAAAGLDNEHNVPNSAKPVVLVPFDLSPEIDEIAALGIDIAHDLNAQLLLLHAVLLNLGPYNPGNLRELEVGLCAEIVKHAEQIILSAQEKGVYAMFVLEEGPPATAIARAVDRWHPDLILLAAHPHHGLLSRIFRRHTIDKIIQHAQCPVMVLQSDEKKTPHE